jgi:hypothetical protein
LSGIITVSPPTEAFIRACNPLVTSEQSVAPLTVRVVPACAGNTVLGLTGAIGAVDVRANVVNVVSTPLDHDAPPSLDASGQT